MNDELHAALSAFLDGEPVESDELLAALSLPDARETLLELLRVKDAVSRDLQSPSNDFYTSMRARLRVPSPAPLSRRLRRPLALVASAAAVLVVGFLIGRGVPLKTSVEELPLEPPPVDREVEFVDGVDWFRS